MGSPIPILAPEAPGQGTGRSQHRDSRRRSRRERHAQQQPGLPLNLKYVIKFKLHRHVKIATALAGC
jgi:hypothetical protein